MKTKLFFIPFILLLSACQNSPSVKQDTIKPTTSIPSWINNPPSDSGNFLYGSGAADTKKQAISEALVDLSSKLGIHVESKFQSNTKVTEYGYESVEKNAESQIKTEVKDLSINQYQIEKVYSPSPIQFYVLLKTDKTLLYTAYKDELEQALSLHQAAQITYKKSGKYERYQQACKNKLSLTAFNRKLSAAKTLNPEMRLRTFQAYENKVDQQFRIAKRQLNFNIHFADNNSKAFSKPLSTALAKADLWKNHSKSLVIKLSSSARFNQASGFYIGRYLLDLKIYDGQHLIGGKQINLKGASLQSKNGTLAPAIKKLTKLIKKEGLWKTLGLQEVECQ
ncbi:MAG: LPP20 family lipoprotein [Methyloprofundus sp.]|nr:LPP20 family lipoprotein [Methyloprofundus sp.]